MPHILATALLLLTASLPAQAEDSLPRISHTELNWKRKPIPVLPAALKSHMVSNQIPKVSCQISHRYDARGRFVEIKLDACDAEVAELVQPTLQKGWRSVRIVLPEGAEQGIWVESKLSWRLR